MRVIAGSARRLKLKTIPGTDVRPTTDRIKETLFNIISAEIYGCAFLDLFAGSGGIGIEALSRGASRCVFIENGIRQVECIKENLRFTHLEDKAQIYHKDVISAIKELSANKQSFDIVYIDPPYNQGSEKKVLFALSSSNIIDFKSLIIIEADKESDFDWLSETAFDLIRCKVYKTNKHLFLKMKNKGANL